MAIKEPISVETNKTIVNGAAKKDAQNSSAMHVTEKLELVVADHKQQQTLQNINTTMDAMQHKHIDNNGSSSVNSLSVACLAQAAVATEQTAQCMETATIVVSPQQQQALAQIVQNNNTCNMLCMAEVPSSSKKHSICSTSKAMHSYSSRKQSQQRTNMPHAANAIVSATSHAGFKSLLHDAQEAIKLRQEVDRLKTIISRVVAERDYYFSKTLEYEDLLAQHIAATQELEEQQSQQDNDEFIMLVLDDADYNNNNI